MNPTHTLIRHAESAANAGLPTADPAAIPLTAAGCRAAAAFAESYVGPRPARIVVSPFLRARRTAEPFIARFPGVRVEEWPVQEFTYLAPGRCGNSTAEQRKPRVEAYWRTASADDVDGPGAESFAAFLERVRDCIRRLAALPDRTVVFTHEMVMKAILWTESGVLPASSTPLAFRDYSLRFSIPNLGTLEWPPLPRDSAADPAEVGEGSGREAGVPNRST